jgi:hypothetical protein
MTDFKLKYFSKYNTIFFLLALFYILFGLLIFKYYQFDPISRDLISIMSIAKIYATGDWSLAINGYWGPLYSWLLVPIIFFNPTPQFTLFSTKILALIIGFITMVGIRFLSYCFKLQKICGHLCCFCQLLLYYILFFALIL